MAADATPKKETKPDVPTSKLIESFKSCRRVSTPIVAIETPDPAMTIATLMRVLPTETPILSWDCVRGLKGLNNPGQAAFDGLQVDQQVTVNVTESLLAAEKLPQFSVLFLHNAHLQIIENGHAKAEVVQAIWNLRNPFKSTRRLLVLLGPVFQLPPELSSDVFVLDEPLPTRQDLSGVIDRQHKNAKIELPSDDTRDAVLDALVGLPFYTAEEVTAMSLEKTGINVAKCWERKIKAIENTEGLKVYSPKPGDTTIDELQGIDNVVDFMKQLIKADAFGAIVFIDEMDKALAGGMSDHTGDSGVSKDQVQSLLTYIEDTGSLGVLLAGVAGTGKTQLAKATGAASKKPVIVFDLGGMKTGLVGGSEQQIRAALKVITATAEGRVLFIGTANRTTHFTPELNRRFPDQFFYDTPDDKGRAAIWPVYIKKNGLTASQAAFPKGFDAGWTGAEIKRACERAALFGCTVVEAARFIIPANVSHKQVIDGLRQAAAGRFLSASYPGHFKLPVSGQKAHDDDDLDSISPDSLAGIGKRKIDLN